MFLTDNMEQGIHTLKERGIVSPDIPVLPPAREWGDVMGMLDALATGDHNYKALALDAMGGLERLCHEEVCRRDHAGDWGKKGFVNYQAGYDTALADWRHFINALERLRDERNMTVILIGHSKVKPFKNPAGPDYDRYIVDVHEKTWAMTCKWAEMVLFINYEVAFAKGDESKTKAKASGGRSASPTPKTMRHTRPRTATTCQPKSYSAAKDRRRHGKPLLKQSKQERWLQHERVLRAGFVFR